MTARSFSLPTVIDLVAVTPLRDNLLALRGQDIEIDAGAVERIGGLGIQLLLSAELTWRQDGHICRTVRRSPAMTEALRLSGAALSDS
ncbi:MAG TPA: STAS domain-containing protein [Hyphomonadaceae bacterium]|jgi:chemotaxis protein CheX|nr:STAS domain-containing protein [Hyphomonadaceae bacterium]